jgi:hypothetical protein
MAFRFQISANLLSWPSSCACCGGDADTKLRASAARTTGKRVQRTTTSWWEVPYCSQCVRHKEAYDSASIWLWASWVLGVFVWFLVAQVLSASVGFFVGAIVALLGIWPYQAARTRARTLMLSNCCSPTAAVRYVEWHGTFHTFVFASKSYLELFLAANSRKKRSDITQI